MALQSRSTDELLEDLRAQVKRLSEEVASIRQTTSRRASDSYEDVAGLGADFYRWLMQRSGQAGHEVSKRAALAAEGTRQHPAITAAVGLGVIALLATFLARR